MTYVNESCWKHLHGRFKGRVGAVGRPGLSEALPGVEPTVTLEQGVKLVCAPVLERLKQGRHR